MRLVPDEHPLEGAGLCFLCEGFMSREKVRVVDSNRDFDPQFQHPLVGRKYICEECGTSIGYALGMVRNEDVEAAKRAIEDTRRRLLDLQHEVSSLAGGIEDSVHSVINLPVLDLPKAVTDKQEVGDSGA